MQCQSYDSMGGRTGRVDIEDETYLITDRNLGTTKVTLGGYEVKERETIDIDYRNHIIRIYSDAPWKVHPMNQNSKTVPVEILEKS